ncbi:hypothetical protein ACLBKU_16035 [Erythrobacter sp. NE805]|uniref:hypothetical protein n=1 Tax=Erythrobacter sp. NE805 TaxID=3389875 RepID=UPI00396B2A9E
MSPRPVRADARVISIDPNAVLVTERIGFMHEDKAVALGRMIAVDGQRTPIMVTRQFPRKSIEECFAEGRKPWKLVVGWTRLRGCQIEGIEVLALEVKGTAQELAELEASENIDRREIGPLEKAKFVVAIADAARARVAAQLGETLSNQQLAIKARWARAKAGEAGLNSIDKATEEEGDDTRSTMDLVYGWQQSVRDAFGLSASSIKRFIKLYRMLVEPFPELAEPLARHPIVGENFTQLMRLADLRDDGARRRVIEALIADAEIGVAEAMIAAKVDTPTPPPAATPVAHQKHWNAIDNNWSKLGVTEKRLYLPKFVKLLSEDMKAQLRALLDEESSDA